MKKYITPKIECAIMTSEDVIAFSINTTDEADFSRNEYDIGNIW